MFVPLLTSADRAVGVVLSLVLDGWGGCSFLLFLDSRSFQEIGRTVAPHAIPFGFHGIFVAQQKAASCG